MPACSGALVPSAVRHPAMVTRALLSSTLLLKVMSGVNTGAVHFLLSCKNSSFKYVAFATINFMFAWLNV